MSAYRVINKHIFRTETQDIQMGTRMDGSPNIVRQPGAMHRIEVGTILEDVTPEELATAPDRFALVDDATAEAAREQGVGLAMHAPLRGCHEPVNALDAPIQKPPLTAPEVVAAKAATAEVVKLDQQQAEQRQKMDQERADAYDKAMTETVAAEVTKAQQQAREARGRGQSSPPPPSALPVSTSGEADPAHAAATGETSTPATPASSEPVPPGAVRPRR